MGLRNIKSRINGKLVEVKNIANAGFGRDIRILRDSLDTQKYTILRPVSATSHKDTIVIKNKKTGDAKLFKLIDGDWVDKDTDKRYYSMNNIVTYIRESDF